MPENTNKVIQLKDAEGNDVSPVVNVGSIYDKNGQKVDNLLSYTVAGTDVPVPEINDLKNQIKSELDGTVNAATLDGSTKEQIIAAVPAPDLSSYATESSLTSHTGNTGNPHNVTKAQIGLGNVDNTADASKSVNYANSAGSAGTASNTTPEAASLKNIQAGTSDIGVGVALATGTVYLVYE